MARYNSSERWVSDIEQEVEDFQNFTPNAQWREATIKIFDETNEIGGSAAAQQLGNAVMELVENRRHPKTQRIKSMAKRALHEQGHDLSEISPTSYLVKGRLG